MSQLKPLLLFKHLLRAPNGIRTRVTAVKGRCPRPLDDGDVLRLGNLTRDYAWGQTRLMSAKKPLFAGYGVVALLLNGFCAVVISPSELLLKR